MQTHTSSTFDNHVTLTLDFLTREPMHAKRLPRTVCRQSLVLIAQAAFRLHTDRHTHEVTDATDHLTHA